MAKKKTTKKVTKKTASKSEKVEKVEPVEEVVAAPAKPNRRKAFEDNAESRKTRAWLAGKPRKHPLHCLLYTSPSPRDLSTSRMPSSA